MSNLDVIPVFVAVAEHQGFAAAAAELGVTKSAVSKRIRQLEERLGVQLLHRTTRKVSLTEAGERYLSHAVAAVAAARDAEDAVAQVQSAPKGRLKINTPMSFGRLHIAPIIAEFLQKYPGLSVDMVMEDRVVDLVQGGYDVAIRAGTLPDSALIARKLAPCHNILCASMAYLKRHGAPSKPADLLDHNCLHYAYFSDVHEWTFLEEGKPLKIQTTGTYQVNNSEALRAALIGGAGIGRLPTFIAGEDMASGQLVRVLETYPMPEQTLYAVFPERTYLPAKVRVFVDFVVETFGKGQPYWDRSIFRS